MTTLVNMRTAVRDRLDESAAAPNGAWTNAQLTRWINDIVRDVARRTMSLQKTSSPITIAPGDKTFMLPADMYRVMMVVGYDPDVSTATDPWKLEYVDQRAAARHYQNAGTGQPRLFSTWGVAPSVVATLYPGSDVSMQILVSYYSIPADRSADNDVLQFNAGWDDLIVDGVEYMALRMDRNPAWQDAKALYEQHIMDAIETMSEWVDALAMIDPVSGMSGISGGLPGWITNWEGGLI